MNKLKIGAVDKFSRNRKGSLHLISKCKYLGKYERTYITVLGDLLTTQYYNIAFLFSRITKEGKLVNRYRVVGIGYECQPKFVEFNKIFSALTGNSLKAPVDGRLTNFETLGHKIEKGINENEFQAYVQWKDQGSFSAIEEISLYTGDPIIKRTDEMDFPKSFYEKYLPNYGNALYIAEQEIIQKQE